jgi:hypothetical protein
MHVHSFVVCGCAAELLTNDVYPSGFCVAAASGDSRHVQPAHASSPKSHIVSVSLDHHPLRSHHHFVSRPQMLGMHPDEALRGPSALVEAGKEQADK